jgi:hypothetical protein
MLLPIVVAIVVTRDLMVLLSPKGSVYGRNGVEDVRGSLILSSLICIKEEVIVVCIVGRRGMSKKGRGYGAEDVGDGL